MPAVNRKPEIIKKLSINTQFKSKRFGRSKRANMILRDNQNRLVRNKESEVITYLEFLKREIQRRHEEDGYVVIDDNSGEIGLFFGYKHNGQLCAGKLYLINAKTDFGYVNYVYDNNGRSISTHAYNNDGSTIQFRLDDNVEINEIMLKRQMQLGIENIREKKADNGSSQGGAGRDKHIEKNKEEQVKTKRKSSKEELKNKNETKDNILVNLKEYGISINRRTRIPLKTVINGHYLYNVIGYESKIKDRLPDGVSEKSFRNGFLTVIDSEELEKIDGKKRERSKTFALSTYDGNNIIELDEQVLEPQPEIHRYEQKRLEDGTLNLRDGKEAHRPETYKQNTEKALYKIPNVGENFYVGEDWFLSVDTNWEYQQYGDFSHYTNKDEISLVQQTVKSSQITVKDQTDSGRMKIKLEAANEPHENELERKQREMLERPGINEAKEERQNHLKELANKIFYGKDNNNFQKLYKEQMQEIYNYNQILDRVNELHDEGLTDEEIENEILIEANQKIKRNEGAKVIEFGPTDRRETG